MWIFFVFSVALIFRLSTLSVSVRHERALKAAGAKEYGKRNSQFLATLHVLFYVAAIGEANLRRPALDLWSKAGMGLYLAGSIVLLVVMHALGRLWTVKLILAKDHAISTHWVFGLVRHPNYLLAIVPELAGLALCMHAFTVLAILGPVYSIPLWKRIAQENAVMKRRFAGY